MVIAGCYDGLMTIELYDNPVSGHAHRVRLFLSLLDLEHESIEVNMREGEHKTADYLKLSPLGQVPTLIDDDVIITDSCAALVYLAKRYGDDHWLPDDPEGAARVQRWLSTASGELYRGPVIARAIELFGRDFDYDAAAQWSDRLLPWMQSELTDRTWLADDHATIADVAMYSYLRVADEGGLDITDYPAIERWLADVEQLDGFIPMTRSG